MGQRPQPERAAGAPCHAAEGASQHGRKAESRTNVGSLNADERDVRRGDAEQPARTQRIEQMQHMDAQPLAGRVPVATAGGSQ